MLQRSILTVLICGIAALAGPPGAAAAEPSPAEANYPDEAIGAAGVGFCGCDLVRDGIIDLYDLAVLAAYWGADDCWVQNDWCDGADINQDSYVGFRDLRVMAVLCWLQEDTTPPTPDPMQWDRSIDANGLDGTPHEVPRPCGMGTCYWAVMRADPNTADETGFEFYFECGGNSGFDSGWISFPDGPPYKYEVNLGLNKQGWSWRVRARDTSINQNLTAWSDWAAPPWP